MIQYTCKFCNAPLQSSSELAGQIDPCPVCRHDNQVPLPRIDYKCPYCSTLLQTSGEVSGRLDYCPQCNAPSTVPTPKWQLDQEAKWRESRAQRELERLSRLAAEQRREKFNAWVEFLRSEDRHVFALLIQCIAPACLVILFLWWAVADGPNQLNRLGLLFAFITSVFAFISVKLFWMKCVDRWNRVNEKCPHGIFINHRLKHCLLCEQVKEDARRQDEVARRRDEEARRQNEARREQAKREVEEEWRQARIVEAKRVHDLSYLRQMPPHQFEKFVVELYRRLGWDGKVTPLTNDQGIDGILTKDGRKAIVQCKRYGESNPVGAPALYSLLGVVHKENAQIGILVTTSYFTRQAREWHVGTLKLQLVDAPELLKLISNAFGEGAELELI